MTLEEEVVLLRAENRQLKELLAQALQRIAELEHLLAQMVEAADSSSGSRQGPPSFVKPNRPKPSEPKSPRRKRAAQHNHGRHRQEPTKIVHHALEHCPECNCRLHGQSLDYRRQVIELPEPQPVEVIQHEVIKRWCPKCEHWRSPKLELQGEVFGQGRMGTRLVSLIAYLRSTLRLPVRQIQGYLGQVHRLQLSIGEIVELLHDVRRRGQREVEALKDEARRSQIMHADETGWREGGQNGYIWIVLTGGPGRAVRYYEYDKSRSHAVVKRLLGGVFKGHLVTDFYAGYNEYAGAHQRCWVHLLRDLHELKEGKEPGSDEVVWATEVRKLYDEAQEWLEKTRSPDGVPRSGYNEQRRDKYAELVQRARALGLQYARDKKHACWALAKRILRHEEELFQFVLIEGLAADNNLAERGLRPLVVARKISGGTRSAEGTKTRMALASLFETWTARGLDPFQECLRLLQQPTAHHGPTPLPQP